MLLPLLRATSNKTHSRTFKLQVLTLSIAMRHRDAIEPCKICKLRRKKCVRSISKTECDRCLEFQIECRITGDGLEDLEISLRAKDGDQQLEKWRADVDRLNSEMQQLAEMKTDLEQTTTAQPQPGMMEWQLCITNGVMRLDTPIKTMEELLMFSQASIRYLSPFAGVFKRAPLRFESTTISISFGLLGAIQRQELLKPRNKRFAALGYGNTNIDNLTPDEYRGIIDHLISLYLRHCVSVFGLLHVPTFLEYYHSVNDPLDNALILAICVDALVNLRQALPYSPIKKRILADALYDRCKDLLFDLYDDPQRKLEVIFTTTFLQRYLSDVTLNALEAGRLASVALLLCVDLRKSTNGNTAIHRALLQRHYLYLEASARLYQMTHEGKVDFTLPETVGEVEILDDEPEITKTYIALYNHIFRFLGSRYITTILGTLNSIYLGQSCEILLEDLLQLEPLAREWWSSLPDDFRLCDDPFDPKAYPLVEQVLPPKQLFPFLVLHVVSCSVSSSVLKPDVSPSPDNTTTINVIQAVREKLISQALNSCKVLVHSLKMNLNPDTSDIPSISLAVMLYVHYCLDKIARCADIPFPQDLLDLLKEAVNTKLDILISAEHEVPPSSSLLVTSLESSTVSPYDVYERYPFANEAQNADVLRSAVRQLDKYLVSHHP
ncbi:hypothetical protein BJV82DRAFT_605984 [Fennellomyces sp. T-0311]|nr:hypothetical protein BJV82DRAFT_605984 [Fennellomyces sp. T-0311]